MYQQIHTGPISPPLPHVLSVKAILIEGILSTCCASAQNCHFKATFPQGRGWLRSWYSVRFQHACKCCPLKIYQWASVSMCLYLSVITTKVSSFSFSLPPLAKENIHSFCPKTNFGVPSEQGSLLCLRLTTLSLSTFGNCVHNEWFSWHSQNGYNAYLVTGRKSRLCHRLCFLSFTHCFLLSAQTAFISTVIQMNIASR